MENNIAHTSIVINAPISKVWEANVNPDAIKEYMFGTTVVSDWQEGSPIVWKGEWEGKPYEDKGVITKIEPGHILQYTHFSAMEGKPDEKENYHTVTIELIAEGEHTTVSLSQDNNPTEEAQEHAEKLWGMMLENMKKFLEK